METGWIGRYESTLLYFMTREYGDLPEPVATALIFVSLFAKSGHVCLPLDRNIGEWLALLDIPEASVKKNIRLFSDELLKHPAVSTKDDYTPFIIEGNFLFMRKYWSQELQVAKYIRDLASKKRVPDEPARVSEILNSLFADTTDKDINWQKVAAAFAIRNHLLIISGGPGTGKTTTVALIISLLQRVSRMPLRIALAAPTGKAAARMNLALRDSMLAPAKDQNHWNSIPQEAKTLHRLLKDMDQNQMLPSTDKRFLPYDLVVVDEASMIDLVLMEKLLSRIGKNTRLILLGDKDQLSSVEAGAILSDICYKNDNRFSREGVEYLAKLNAADGMTPGERDELEDSIVYLTKSYRFSSESGISALADCVNRQDAFEAMEVLKGERFSDVSIRPFGYQKEDLTHFFDAISNSVENSKQLDDKELAEYWTREVWLGVLRRGLFGTESLNRKVEEYLSRRGVITPADGWYHGRPVIITRNDYSLGLFNGDLGVCVKNIDGSYCVLFPPADGIERRFAAHRMKEFEPAYLLTVHKSQGSEFETVNLLLPEKDSPVLTKELIYTAVTRARKKFRMYGSSELLSSSINRTATRFTMLKSRLYPGARE